MHLNCSGTFIHRCFSVVNTTVVNTTATLLVDSEDVEPWMQAACEATLDFQSENSVPLTTVVQGSAVYGNLAVL